MAKDILIKYINDLQEWEELYPLTKTRNIKNTAGKSLDHLLSEKYNKNETYSSAELDGKLKSINDTIENLDSFNLPVSKEEPQDSSLWFEIIES